MHLYKKISARRYIALTASVKLRTGSPKMARNEQCAFVSRGVSLLLQAYLVYVRPLVESNSVFWSPCLKQDIDALERVQRRFTKRLPGLNNSMYAERLSRLNLPTLLLRRQTAPIADRQIPYRTFS